MDAPPSLWPVDSLPKFALFCDSTWGLDEDLPTPGWDGAAEIFDALREAALRIVDNIFKRLDSPASQETQ
jgi:hypothetical protein